jgi:hypothetical protein
MKIKWRSGKCMNNNKKFESSDLVRRVPEFSSHSSCRIKFFHNGDLKDIKRIRILRRIQNYKLYLVKIAPKIVIHEKRCIKTTFWAFLEKKHLNIIKNHH